jgi:hypothetical protein
MALQYILQQMGNKTGLNPADSDQRAVLLRFVNEAAIELYQTSDMAGCLEEQYFKVNSNQTISLPDYVGQIRAMREAETHIAIKLSQMRPRFNQYSWADEWRDWRILGLQTLQTSLKNQSILNLTIAAVESTPVVVNITGSSDNSSLVTETVVMNELSVNTVNTYNDVSALTKTTVNQYNVILNDIDGNQLSYIPNNKLKAQFQIVDISTAPWYPPIVSPLLGWVEVLYKKALPWFSNDNDEFPAIGYDNVIVNKCLQLWYEEQNNIQSAMAYMQKANQSLAQIHEDANRGTDDVVSMVDNPHDLLMPRVGFGRDWRYAYRIQGR